MRLAGRQGGSLATAVACGGWEAKPLPHQEAGRRDLCKVLPRMAANHLVCRK